MRIRSKAVGLASLLVAGVIAGCSDDGSSDKTIFQAATHIINKVGIRLATNATGTDNVPHDGVDGASAAITINVEGDDFENYGTATNIVVALAEITNGTFNTSVAGVTTGTAAFPFALLPVTHTYIDQGEISFVMPTTSPLTSVTGDVRVVVLMSGTPNDTKVLTGATPANADVLHLTASAQSATNNGLSGTLAVVGDDAGAFATGYPGQSGILMRATLTNNTGESVDVNSITSDGGSIGFGAATLDFSVSTPDEVKATKIANGGTASFDFVAAHTEDMLLAASSGQVTFATTSTGTSTTGGVARVVSASVSFSAPATPRIQAIGGSIKGLNNAQPADTADGVTSNLQFFDSNPDTITRTAGATFLAGNPYVVGQQLTVSGHATNNGQYRIAAVTATTITLVASDELTAAAAGGAATLTAVNAAGSGGTVRMAASGSVTVGSTSATFTAADPATAAATATQAAIAFVDSINGAAPDGTVDTNGILAAWSSNGVTFTLGSGAGDRAIIVNVAGDVTLTNCVFNFVDAAASLDITDFVIRATGSIVMDGCTFNLGGQAQVTTDAADNGCNVWLISGHNTAAAITQDLTVDTCTFNLNGNNTNTAAAGAGGSLNIGEADTTSDNSDVFGDVFLFSTTVNAIGGSSAFAAGGTGGNVNIEIRDDAALAKGNVVVSSACVFNLNGGGNLGAGSTDVGDGGNLSIRDTGFNDGQSDGGNVIFYGTVITDGGDVDSRGSDISGGIAGNVSMVSGEDIVIGTTGGTTTICTNGGSSSIPGGFGNGAQGGNAGDILIRMDVDIQANTSGNVANDDGEFILASGSALIANGGSADAANAGSGADIDIVNGNSLGTNITAAKVALTIDGTIINTGGWVRPETTLHAAGAGAIANALRLCGFGGQTSIVIDSDIVITGNLISSGGSAALNGQLPNTIGDLLTDVQGGAGGAIFVDATGRINDDNYWNDVSTAGGLIPAQTRHALDAGAGATNNPDVSAFDGDLTISGVLTASGGGTLDRAAATTAPNGGSITAICDGDTTGDTGAGTTDTTDGFSLATAGRLVSNGGASYNRADVSAGVGGTILCGTDTYHSTANLTASSPVVIAGVIRADGGHYQVTDGNGTAAATDDFKVDVYGPCGTVRIFAGEDLQIAAAGETNSNDGEMTISGSVYAMGDGNAGATTGGIFAFVNVLNGVARDGTTAALGGTGALLVSGTLQVGETDMTNTANTRARVELTADEADLTLSSTGNLLGRRSLVTITHGNKEAATDTQTIVNGTITNSDRPVTGVAGDGVVTITSLAEETTLNLDDVSISGATITCNSGTVIITHTDGATGRVYIENSTVNTSATQNTVLGRFDGTNLTGGQINLGNTNGAAGQAFDLQIVSGTFTANGGEVLNNESTPVSQGTGGGGAIRVISDDTLKLHAQAAAATASSASFNANGADQTNGNGGNAGGTITFSANTGAGNIVVNTSGGVNANGGNRGNGGTILVNCSANAVVRAITVATATNMSANAGTNAYVDPTGQVLDGGIGGTITITDATTAATSSTIVAGTLSANGGDNAGGPGGFGGTIGVQRAAVATGTVTLSGTYNANGGTSTYASGGLGGDAGSIRASENVVGMNAGIVCTGATFNANGGVGTSTGGDGGTVDLDNENGGALTITFVTTNSSVNIAAGTGNASGSLGVFLFDPDGDQSLPTTGVLATVTANATVLQNN
jgi:hypothetical protein